MGIDLKVLATSFREHRGEFLSTALLRFERGPRLLALLAPDATPCLVRPLPEGLRVECGDLRLPAGVAGGREDRALLVLTSPGERSVHRRLFQSSKPRSGLGVEIMPDPEVAQPGTQTAALAERPTVIWYGERGVVNALVAALSARDIETGVKRFLREIQWADGGHHSWIDDIVHATLIVEVGLNDFGDPDLIIVCRTGAGDRFVVIIEAKVITYFASALSNARGMVAGKNSNINRQLMLRYRFTLALAAWDGQAPLIIESDPLFHAYARPVAEGGLEDPNRRARRLGQDEILRRILAPQGVHSLPPCHYHLVAMTWDREPFFRQPEVTQEYMPLFLTPAGGDAWESIKGRVGWIGYKAIKERLDPGADFDLALRIMVRSLEPAEAGPRPLDRVDTLNIEDNFKQHGTDSPISRLLTTVENAAKARFGGRAVARNPGSTSVTLGGKVLVKLIPQNPGPNPHLLLGLSEVLSPREWCDPVPGDHRLAGEGRNREPFFFLRLPEPPDEDEALAIADSIFEQLAERMGLDES